jgi:elongator complex protein 6
MSQSLHHDLLSHHISLSSSHLCLVTSVLGASGSWYGHSLLAALLKSSSTVIHLSFLHNAVFHSDAVRKWGVDLGQYGRKGRYVFIDGLSGLFLPDGTKDGVSMQAGLEKLSQQVKEKVKKAAAAVGSGKVVLVVEGPDVLLSVGGVSSMEVVNELLDWHEVSLAGL